MLLINILIKNKKVTLTLDPLRMFFREDVEQQPDEVTQA